ncbi:MAG: MOSC domain-containing protein [Pseudohongiellaceae bacterium]
MGQVEKIFIALESRGAVLEIENAELEAGKGILGDRYHSRAEQLIAEGKKVPDNHISFIAKEELDAFLKTNNSDLNLSDFRRSVITTGVDLNSLVGKEFTVGDALCYGAELCEPCAFLAATVHRKVLPELVEKGGLRATVIRDGSITAGSKIEEA